MRFILISLFILLLATPAQASLIDDLKAKILNNTETVKQLDQEIQQFSTQLQTTQKEKQSLQGEIKQIDGTRAELSSGIKKTEGKISATTETINQLAGDISAKEVLISKDKDSLAESLRTMRELEHSDLLEILLSHNNLSAVLTEAAALAELNKSVDNNIMQLRNIAADLASKKSEQEKQKANLAAQKSQLADQKAIADAAKKQKDNLLIITKNKESNYQQLLADRLKKKQQVEAEIEQFESQLKTVIDPNSLPQTGKGVLSWPLDKVTITQYFGNTTFATQNAQVYGGKGHNGIDLAASVGTPIKAARSGTVTGTGDTDTACVGASFGKWVLIKHDNGISTLYAHLSLIKVAQGQSVTTGDIIGYTGNTGYSTGPHLHFGVYASAGVEVTNLKSKVAGCGIYTLPVASQSAYLNPLSYL